MSPLVSPEELARHLDDPSWIVFDCRHDLTAPEAGGALYRDGHIAGARFASLDRDLSGAKDGSNGRHPLPTREAFADFLERSGVHDDSVIVGYDASGGLYAARLWWMARWIGHAGVAVLDGGMPAWTAAGLALTAELPQPARGRVTVGVSQVALATTADVAANLVDASRLVVDARAPERFRGDVEPMDRVAGHIPGASNHPMARSLRPDGRLQPPEVLRTAFDATLAGRAPETVVQSCGSGVTACFNLLAMEVAGLPGGALYAGSWSAWSSDPTRPVATGD